jgi:hypothetical protein
VIPRQLLEKNDVKGISENAKRFLDVVRSTRTAA